MKISHQWLQTYFEKELPSIQEIDATLVMHSFETEGIESLGNDQILDVDVLPNRAHDCLSYEGIARELAGLKNLPVKETLDRYETSYDVSEVSRNFAVVIENPEQCRRYSSRLIENIQVGESPQWLKDRLESMGQRPINNIVDATNYVLFDIGQPTHVFDADKIIGDTLVVRNAYEGETMETLSGEELKLDSTMLIVADGQGSTDLAGIKGGMSARLDESTANIVLESANFEPISTRKTRQKVGIFTDAAKRFENELSPTVAPQAMEALTRLIIEIAGTPETKVGEVVDEYPTEQEEHSVTFTIQHTNTLTGLSLSESDIANILDRFGYTYQQEADSFTVSVPPRRYDLRIPEDMIEEIGRSYGYENITSQSVADLEWNPQLNVLLYYRIRISRILIELGFNNLMTYTFVKEGDVVMRNALASDKSALRNNLTEGFQEALSMNTRNAQLFGADRICAFEFGKIFTPDEEQWHLVVGVENKDKKAKKQYGTPAEQLATIATKLNEEFDTDLFTLPDDNATTIEWNIETIIASLPVPAEYGDVLVSGADQETSLYFKPFSLQPFVVRDIALWAPATISIEEIQELLMSHATELCQRIDLFDTYQPEDEDRISYAFSLVFQAMDRTLTDEEVNTIADAIYAACQQQGWEIR